MDIHAKEEVAGWSCRDRNDGKANLIESGWNSNQEMPFIFSFFFFADIGFESISEIIIIECRFHDIVKFDGRIERLNLFEMLNMSIGI